MAAELAISGVTLLVELVHKKYKDMKELQLKDRLEELVFRVESISVELCDYRGTQDRLVPLKVR